MKGGYQSQRLLNAVRYMLPRAAIAASGALRSAINSRRFAGETYVCPCCDASCRAFVGLLDGGRCPQCRSRARDRTLWLYLRRTELMSDPLDVVHFAPEQWLRDRLEKLVNLRYRTADLSRRDVDAQWDITAMPIDSESVDVVIANHVLEHVPDDGAAMAEVLRVLRPGGWAVLMVPLEWDRDATYENAEVTTARRRYEEFGQFDHVRRYGLDFSDRLSDAGFLVEWHLAEPDQASAARAGADPAALVVRCTRP